YNKKIELSAITLLCSTWFVLAVAVWVRGGLYVPAFRFFNIIILASALLIKPRWSIYMLCLTSGFAIFLLVYESNMAVSSVFVYEYITESVLFDFVILFMTTFITYMMSTNFKQAYDSLTEVNQTLRRQQSQLQQSIHDLKLAQKQQQKSQHKLKLQSHLLNSATASIIASDMDNKIIYWGRGAEQIHGYAKEDVIFQDLGDITGQSKEQLAEIQTSLYEKGSWHGEQCFTHNNGSVVWMDSTISTVSDENKEPFAIISCSIDINQRKQAEHELRMALELEQELNGLKSRFVSMISHEFRTPLATIYASTQMLHRNFTRLSEQQRTKRFDRISTQISHMTSLIDEALTIGYMESSKLKISCEDFYLDAFIQEICQDFQQIYPTYELQTDLKEIERTVYLDRKLCGQILSNLLANAAKYSAEGSVVSLHVHMEMGETGPETETVPGVASHTCPKKVMTLMVRDTGIGIPAQDQERLFEPFHRAGNVGNIQGTGLGLSITKRATELLNGTIHVASQEDCGTTFYVKIPTRYDEEEDTKV
ncbi:MAG: PAS domain-containing sensor histidine kinase, partial [Chloroflexota bacterium]